MEAVVKALHSTQKGVEEKRWTYTWQGEKVIVVDRWGKILKSMEKYFKVVDVAIQGSPQVSSLLWAGIRAIMQVRNLTYALLVSAHKNHTDSISRLL